MSAKNADPFGVAFDRSLIAAPRRGMRYISDADPARMPCSRHGLCSAPSCTGGYRRHGNAGTVARRVPRNRSLPATAIPSVVFHGGEYLHGRRSVLWRFAGVCVSGRESQAGRIGRSLDGMA
jgi:hypothetical protein